MKNQNEKTGAYTLVIIEDYSSNKGNPIVSEESYNTLIEVEAAFNKEVAEPYREHGMTCRLEIWQDGQDEPIKDAYKNSAQIPMGSVVVSYKHVTYMHYAYAIVAVRKVDSYTTFEDLNASADSTSAVWDRVYESVEDMECDYKNGLSIPFNKLQRGNKVVEEFVEEFIRAVRQ